MAKSRGAACSWRGRGEPLPPELRAGRLQGSECWGGGRTGREWARGAAGLFLLPAFNLQRAPLEGRTARVGMRPLLAAPRLC